MSDLSEFEDTVWDELCQDDDHIVPHPGFERANNHSILGDRHKKLRRDVTNILSTTIDRSAASYVDQEREQGRLSTLNKRTTMLEKDSSACLSTGVYPSSDSDSIKKALSLASDNARSSSPGLKSNNTGLNGSVLCADDNDTILNDKTMEVDNSSFSYPLGDITHAGNNLNFLENNYDKDSGDLLYYGWSEIGNFEDVDRMFSCDSTFGLGSSKEDELGWFSSTDDIGLSGNVLKSNIKFPISDSEAVENISENHNSSKSYSASESAMTSGPMRYQDSSWMPENSDPYVSFVNGPDVADNKDGFIPKEQINEGKKQFKLQTQSVGKAEEHCFENGSFDYNSNISNEIVQLPSGASHQSSPCVHMQQRASGPDFCYVQNPTSYVHPDDRHLSDPTLIQQPPVVKSEANGLTPLALRDSSRASSQLTVLTGNAKRQKLHKLQGSRSSVNSSIKNASMTMQATIYDCGSLGKQVHFSGDKFGNQTGLDGVSLVPAELVSSDVQDSLTKNPGFDDISLEAATFRQLQLVTEQLDLRTKLCIRDSLYRLAQSAEQRHNHANLNGDERDSSRALMAEGKNNFMDIETDTNPIDRSIAHLLFHRPSESSVIPAKDSMQFKSPSAVHGSITSMPVMVENLDTRKEIVSVVEKVSD